MLNLFLILIISQLLYPQHSDYFLQITSKILSEDPTGHPVYITRIFQQITCQKGFFSSLIPCQFKKIKMQFTLKSAFLFLFAAEFASAARFTQERWERRAARLAARNNRHSSFRLPPTNSTGHEVDSDATIEIEDQPQVKNGAINKVYSQNWAGSILIGAGYTAVTGTFVVPSPSAPVGGSSTTQVGYHLDSLGFYGGS